ncbi:uncharacterized protein LOC113216434 [Frankliniella occidentalis]|uniref:Uncharacterized protein LOC113216434 n=1 Tax=Frankliniella occidentalis TaxID=133901 RepID=A0A9C6TVY4_FRAOC|nr:uncharacterized protein LOC113216434 [Frankliniella occidentalis]
MSPIIIVTLAFLCQKGIYGKTLNTVIGPYITYAERFYMCEPHNRALPVRWHLRTTHFKPLKPKELQLLTGNLTMTELFDDSFQVKMVLDVRSNNQWKENAFVVPFLRNGCSTTRDNVPNFFKAFSSKRETKGACVYKPGVYEFNDTPVEWTFPNVAVMPYGHYRARINVTRLEKLYACLVADARIIPKLE